MPPARMKRDVERRIGPARRARSRASAAASRPAEIDREMFGSRRSADRQHPVRALAHRLAALKRKRPRGSAPSGGTDQYLSSGRPTASVRSSRLGAARASNSRRPSWPRSRHARRRGTSSSGIGTRSTISMPCADQRVVLHVAHRDEAVDALDAEPVERRRASTAGSARPARRRRIRCARNRPRPRRRLPGACAHCRPGTW